uniref:phosphatidylinositol 3-kinase n=1 Tax=Palpitomonas bilix TaxID=652834 RepID=A0A7S3G0V9_9EUKA
MHRQLESGPGKGMFRVRVLGAELRTEVEQVVTISGSSTIAALDTEKQELAVEVGLYYGGKALSSVVYSRPVVAEAEPRWMQWVELDVPVHRLPRETKVCFTVVSAKSGRLQEGRSGSVSQQNVKNIGWGARYLFGHDDYLIQGKRGLHLWPGEKANPAGCAVDYPFKEGGNHLFVEFDEYPLPVSYSSAPPCVNVKTFGRTDALDIPADELEVIRRAVDTPFATRPPDNDRDVVWRYRHHIWMRQNPYNLPLLLLCADWTNPTDVAEVLEVMFRWPNFPPTISVSLLDAPFSDTDVREFAVTRINKMGDHQFSMYLNQLTQALKYEPRHESALAQLLLVRSKKQPSIVGQIVFWNFRAEVTVAEYRDRFRLLLETISRYTKRRFRSSLFSQSQVMRDLLTVAMRLKNQPKNSDRLGFLRDELQKIDFPPTFCIPLDSRVAARGLIVDKCKFMDSKKLPLWLVFKNADKDGPNIPIILKAGDDLRQDILTLQIISLMDILWQHAGLDLRLKPYKVVATGWEQGMIEVVENAETVANIQKRFGGAMGAFLEEPIMKWLNHNRPATVSAEEVIENFVRSCAGYCVATYVIGIGDRHNDNIMVTKDGHLFHIDFGHFLGNIKRKFGIKRERAPFVFTPDFAYVMGKKGAPAYTSFVNLCMEAYNVIRRNARTFFSLFSMMLETGMPELQRVEDLRYLESALNLGVSDEEAGKIMAKLIEESVSSSWTQLNFAIHIAAH